MFDFSGFADALGSPRARGIMDLTGRIGNAMQTSGDSPNPQMYSPAQPGLAGVMNSARNLARPSLQVRGGRMQAAPSNPYATLPNPQVPTWQAPQGALPNLSPLAGIGQ